MNRSIKTAIPNAVTLSGAFLAMLAMAWAPHEPYWACKAIIFCSITDMLDGRLARMLGAQTELGKHLDSLVDVVAFGVAPAFLAYAFRLHELSSVGAIPLGIVLAFAFVAASALRLAIFGAKGDTSGLTFRGIPTPVSALFVTTTIMVAHELKLDVFGSAWAISAAIAATSVLMLVPVDFPSFKAFRNRMLATAYFSCMAGGVLMLIVGLPGGTVLFGFLVFYLLIGAFGAVTGGPTPATD